MPLCRPQEDGTGSGFPFRMRSGVNNDVGGLPFSHLLRRDREAAFEDFVRRHSAPLFKLALRRVANYHDAEEIVYETFERARKGRFRRESKEITWLYRICGNLCIDYWRGKRRQLDCVSLDELVSKSPAADEQLSQLAAGGPEQESLLDLWEAITKLPENERWAFVLTAVCGFSVTAAAKILGVPRTTLDHRQKAACRRLATAIGEPPSREGT